MRELQHNKNDCKKTKEGNAASAVVISCCCHSFLLPETPPILAGSKFFIVVGATLAPSFRSNKTRGTCHSSYFALIPVLRMAVLISCLLVVAPLTESLPVGFVPEELRITAMWNDVVNYSCLRVHALFHAFLAKRMSRKVTLTRFLPAPAIPTTPRTSDLLWVKRFMLLTILLSCRDQLRTAWMSAGNHRFTWHLSAPSYSIF